MSPCRFEGCTSRAKFGNNAAQYCSKHKSPEMKAIGMNFCKFEECTKKASYGYERPIRCKAHKEADMKSFHKTYCSHAECLKNPTFGVKGQKPTCCSEHRVEGMFNSIKGQCELCTTQPSYGFQGGRYTRCGKHREHGMIYLRFPLCKVCGSPSRFGTVRNRPTHCSSHKEENMWNVIDRTCKECTKRPTYGYTKAEWCQDHMKTDMKVFTRNFCDEDGCSKTACYNVPGSNEALYCTGHARDGMINIWEKKCCICFSVRARKDYEGHCAQCFSHAFPDSHRIRKYKTKERAVKDFLIEKWPESLITHDKAVECFRFRPDFVIELGTHTIVIEVDEFQHQTYETSCENKRLMSVFQGLGSRPMVMIRFNPDSYTNSEGKRVKGCWHGSGLVLQQTEWHKRLAKLETTVQKWWNVIPGKEVTIEHLFYTPLTGT